MDTESTNKRPFLVRVFASDGVSVRDEWIVNAPDAETAGVIVADDPRIKPDTDYAITEKS